MFRKFLNSSHYLLQASPWIFFISAISHSLTFCPFVVLACVLTITFLNLLCHSFLSLLLYICRFFLIHHCESQNKSLHPPLSCFPFPFQRIGQCQRLRLRRNDRENALNEHPSLQAQSEKASAYLVGRQHLPPVL